MRFIGTGNASRWDRRRVGELRPSQLLTTFGVGSVVDLPNISAMVMGLDDWDITQSREIGEERLRRAVQQALGPQVTRLLTPPIPPEATALSDVLFGDAATVGVPVAPFPRWMVCPSCHILAPLEAGFFQLKADPAHPDRARYVHQNCSRGRTAPVVLPARFLVACPRGHLDDFPWVYFVHRGVTECPAALRLNEFGVSGEAADVRVTCDTCGVSRTMADAFGQQGRAALPPCQGRRPQLRDYEEQECPEPMRAILLGASNSWFAVLLSVLSVPQSVNHLEQLVEAHWHVLEKASSQQNVELLRAVGQLNAFAAYTDSDLWDAIERRRTGVAEARETHRSIKAPEWAVFSRPERAPATRDFRAASVDVPDAYRDVFERVTLVERLRVVSALVGFTRIYSPRDFGEIEELPEALRAPITRQAARWAPASDVRGEGIFIQFREAAIQHWFTTYAATRSRERQFLSAYRFWRAKRRLDTTSAASRFAPTLRYVLLHSFAHALMRQFALECGYAAASLTERIYALSAEADDGPMAGVLIYTAAPDSEGTLGGLVSLGAPDQLGAHVQAALAQMRLCASDPLCAEHTPLTNIEALHGAACHACLFAPETSCEHGNKYLDRAVLVDTWDDAQTAFFRQEV